MHTSNLASNLWKIPLIKGMNNFMLVMPVIVLFFQENGLSLTEVFILQALFSVAVILLEIPSGYFSDRIGRKNSIVIGNVCGALGYTLYALSHGFWGFLCSELILGIGVSFISGADSALLYDSLSELGRTRDYKRIEGRNQSLGMSSEAIASILGGILALVSLRFPLYFEAIIMWLIIPVGLSLVEPSRQKLMPKNHPLSEMFRLTKYVLHGHGEIKWLTLYSSIVGASTLTMVWLIQPYLKEAGLPIVYFGGVWAALMLTGALSSWHAHNVERFLGRQWSLFLLMGFPAIGYLILGSSGTLIGALAIGFFYVTRGFHNPVISDYINGLVRSDIRATVLSVKNLIGRMLFSVIGPCIGWVRDGYSLSLALFASGSIFLFLGLIALIALSKVEKEKALARV